MHIAGHRAAAISPDIYDVCVTKKMERKFRAVDAPQYLILDSVHIYIYRRVCLIAERRSCAATRNLSRAAFLVCTISATHRRRGLFFDRLPVSRLSFAGRAIS